MDLVLACHGGEMEMTGENKALEIQASLKGMAKDRFLEIKKFKGLADDEVLRLMINEYFEKKLARNKSGKC
ncbi:MAG: hypothetical protein QXV85_10185 [Candidatus Bathyarchaeia archaeon]